MQHPDNYMDDMFRRAAEDYPLKADKDNWQVVAERMAAINTPSPVAEKKDNKRRFIFFLFLALMLSGAFYITNKSGWLKDNAAVNEKENSVKENKVPERSIVNVDNTGAAEIISSDKIISSSDNANVLAKKNTEPPQIDNSIPDNLNNLHKEAVRNYLNNTAKKNIPKVNKTNYYNPPFVKVFKTEKPGLTYSYENIYPDRSFIKAVKNEVISYLLNSTIGENNKLDELLKNRKEETKSAIPVQNNKKGFYAGFIAGPDFSSIKSQHVKNAGFDYGLLAGYKLNKNISIETGLIFENKRYYTTADYFKMDKVGSSMPTGMKVEMIESKTAALEIPLSLKYDFFLSKKSNLFIKPGISIYVLLNEKNNYQVMYNGVKGVMNAEYGKNICYTPSVINLSTGYESVFGKNYKIRIEPYIKIPVKGVGIGSLPVTSAGIHLGVTKFLR